MHFAYLEERICRIVISLYLNLRKLMSNVIVMINMRMKLP